MEIFWCKKALSNASDSKTTQYTQTETERKRKNRIEMNERKCSYLALSHVAKAQNVEIRRFFRMAHNFQCGFRFNLTKPYSSHRFLLFVCSGLPD